MLRASKTLTNYIMVKQERVFSVHNWKAGFLNSRALVKREQELRIHDERQTLLNSHQTLNQFKVGSQKQARIETFINFSTWSLFSKCRRVCLQRHRYFRHQIEHERFVCILPLLRWHLGYQIDLHSPKQFRKGRSSLCNPKKMKKKTKQF